MKKEKSCGIVVFNDDKILVVKQNAGHYGFPKGHVEENETEFETAIREVKEETNVDAAIVGNFRDVITYSPKEDVLKDVIFFSGKALSFDLKNQETEISKVMFCDFEKAFKLVTYENEKKILKDAIKYYEDNKKLFE